MLKNLSLYGWISGIIIGLLCTIFMIIAANGPSYWVMSTAYTTSDDDTQSSNDICWTNGFPWPNKVWSLSLSNGLCFPKVPDGNTLTSSSQPFSEIVGSDSFTNINGNSCWQWGAKTKGSVVDIDIYSDSDTNGLLMGICTSAESLAVNDNLTPGSVTCKNFDSYSKKFQSAGMAAKAGAAFGVFATLCSIAGCFFANKEGSTKSIAQGVAGFCFLIVFMTTLVTLTQASATGSNPYLTLPNVLSFGCIPAYLSGNYVFVRSMGPSGILTIVTLFISATMGGLSLTMTQCFNPCCCPCCFTADVVTTQSPMNGDNAGVKV